MIREIPLPFEGDPFKFHCLARYGKMVYLNDVCSVYTVGGGYYSSSSVLTQTWIPGNDFAMMMRYGTPPATGITACARSRSSTAACTRA